MNQNLMPALNYYNNLSPWVADMYIDIQKQAQMLVSRNLLSDFNFLLFLAGKGCFCFTSNYSDVYINLVHRSVTTTTVAL
jgi:hypothetical protein